MSGGLPSGPSLFAQRQQPTLGAASTFNRKIVRILIVLLVAVFLLLGPLRDTASLTALLEQEEIWSSFVSANDHQSAEGAPTLSIDTLLVNSTEDCPLGLFKDAEHSALNGQPQHQQNLIDVAIHVEAATPSPKKAKRLPRPLLIPRTIIHVTDLPQVPIGMLQALKRIRKLNPNFEIVTFCDATAEEYVRSHFNETYQKGFDGLKLRANRAEYFTYLYLLENGGFALNPSLLADTDTDQNGHIQHSASGSKLPVGGRLSRFINPLSTLVLAMERRQKLPKGELGGENVVYDDGAMVSSLFIGAAQGHPFLQKVVADITEIVLDGGTSVHDHSVRTQSWEHVSGPAVLTEFLRKHFIKGKKNKNEFKAFAKNLNQSIVLNMGKKVANGSLQLFPIITKPWCHMGALVSNPKMVHFWTKYPTYGREMRWYRYSGTGPDVMDPQTAWDSFKMFTEWRECRRKTDLKWRPVHSEPPRLRAFMDWAPHRSPTTQPSSQQKIPRIIMQTNGLDVVPPMMKQAMMSILERNPDYEYYYFSDRRAREFVVANFPQDVIAAFDAIVPGALKADLFRYCWLVKMGGVYLDADMQAGAQPLSAVIRPTDEFVSPDDCGNNYVYNAFIACTPGHEYMKWALNAAVYRITKREYGSDPLWITGPRLLQDILQEYTGLLASKPGLYMNGTFRLIYHDCNICEGRVVDRPDTPREDDSTTVVTTPYYLYRTEMMWYTGKKFNYYRMWRSWQVYTDGNPNITNAPGI